MNSSELEIGDTVQIDKACEITTEFFPEVVGSHVEIDGFDKWGHPMFLHTDEPVKDCPFTKMVPDHLVMNEEDGWEFTIL